MDADAANIFHKLFWCQQVETPFVGTPGFVELSKNIILAGDGFVQSGIEGCIESSQKTVDLLEKLLH